MAVLKEQRPENNRKRREIGTLCHLKTVTTARLRSKPRNEGQEYLDLWSLKLNRARWAQAEQQAKGDSGNGICPATVRASIIIATVAKAYDAKYVARDKSFVCRCHDVLDSSRLGGMPSSNIRDEVNKLIEEHAA